MILAAGRGERLKPLTNTIPKPLIEINNKALIIYHIEALQKIGVRDIIINISYLAQTIKTSLGSGKRWGVNIHYSYEEMPLGWGGGVYQALKLLGKTPFLVISADIFTDYSYEKLALSNFQLAHLVLVDNPSYHPKGDFSIVEGKIQLEGEKKYNFAGFGIYHPDLFIGVKAGFNNFLDVVSKAITEKKVTGEYYKGSWINIGTIEELNLAKKKANLMEDKKCF
ncbi:MAG: mannose-phosphate guanyltransferase [Francisellaceae bacterium]|nr:mannose-phosphate guanyltransferase [Francisellaceae bacterium]